MRSKRDTELLDLFNSYLHIGVDIVEIIIYILVMLVIFRTIFLVIISAIREKQVNYNTTKLLINNAISISLSGIMFVEIMKLFYIKSYKQLGIIAGIVLIKWILLYFVHQEQKTEEKQLKRG
jgi:uncharacterized membrane protein